MILNVVLLMGRGSAPAPAPSPAVVMVEPVEGEAALADAEAVEPMGTEEGEPVAAADAVEGTLATPPAGAPSPEGWHVVRASVQHSFARTMQKAVVHDDPDAVAAVLARLFFWDLDLRRDLQAGDEVALVYYREGDQIIIPAATYHSQKLGKTLEAYRFQASGDAFPSWWTSAYDEAPRRLKGGPLPSYEQVTALLKDRPTHGGMDFKAPVGTPILSPSSGTVTRVNWNTKYNGSCVEVKLPSGLMVKYLHLSEVDVRPGQSVGKGTLLGKVGNTGRSTAPHLHYEIRRNGAVVDPVQHHGLTRRSLSPGEQAAFDAERARLAALLEG